jgi:hypothetical protein
MDRIVEKIHLALAEALKQHRARPFEAPVTVAEIYQDLVPYRAVRATLGFAMNADYEHTLLRLLSGEGGYARLEPDEARDELRAELATPNPNVGLFRKFAACDVWVTPPRGAEPRIVGNGHPIGADDLDTWESRSGLWMTPGDPVVGEAEGGGGGGGGVAGIVELEDVVIEEHELELLIEDPEAALPAATGPDAPASDEVELLPSDPADGDTADAAVPAWLEAAGTAGPGRATAARADGPPAATPPQPAPDAGARDREQEGPVQTMTDLPELGPATPSAVAPTSCAFCDSDLPTGRSVRFCPFCGADQALVPCRACAEPLERGWAYCIACGATAGPR